MQQILTVTGPIYLIIAVGYVAVRRGIISRDDTQVLARVLLMFVLPATVFRAITSHPLKAVLNTDYLLIYGSASLLALLAGIGYAMFLRRRGLTAAAFYGMAVSISNSVFVGYPIASQVLGERADVALAMCLLVENLLILPLIMILADSSGSLPFGQTLLRIGKRLISSPILLAIISGFIVAALDLPLPSVATRALDIFSGAAAPIALFMIGGALVGQSLRGVRIDVATLTLGKLIGHPLLVLMMLAALLALGPLSMPRELIFATVLFAAMPVGSMYPVLARQHGLESPAPAVLVAETALSFISVSIWLLALPVILDALL
jgi:hypothetical protein